MDSASADITSLPDLAESGSETSCSMQDLLKDKFLVSQVAQKHFGEWDANGDGELWLDELEAVYQSQVLRSTQ